MGSDPLNGQELATHGTITYRARDFEVILKSYNFLQGTEEQVDIEKKKVDQLFSKTFCDWYLRFEGVAAMYSTTPYM